MATLKNWSIVADPNNPYMAPELKTIYLQGEVYDHPNSRHHDGKRIITSKVVKKIGPLTYETKSGTIYTLDTVAPAYKEWCSENNIELNLEDPVRLNKSLA